jgi:hypothetical protein
MFGAAQGGSILAALAVLIPGFRVIVGHAECLMQQ